MNERQYDRTLLYGLPQIAAYTGYTTKTIGLWIRRHGFPAGKLPEGIWCTSTAMIDLWLMARNPYAPKSRSEV